MALRNYFSGVEGKQHFEACVQAGAQHVLTSYLYLEKSDLDIVKRRKKKYPHLKFMIDSGAHTFQSDKAKYSSWSLQDFEKYIRRYVNWLRMNREYIECAVELDIDWNVGTTVVESWQKKFFIPLLEEGLDVVFVWHKQRGLLGWEEMCSKFSYVGLPGEFSAEADFNKYMTVAKRYTTKVHGFAATKQSDFRDWPWHSADSTTWKSSERYGTLIHWDENEQRLIFDEDKKNRAQYRKHFLKHGLRADDIINEAPGSYREITKYALISIRLMEAFYERKYKERLFYYELRLPHPSAVARLGRTAVEAWWKKMRPDTTFKAHSNEGDTKKIRNYLAAIAAVQYGDASGICKQSALDFLCAYFPQLLKPALVSDLNIFKKEMSDKIAPSNSAALERIGAAMYVPSNNPPKRREPMDFSLMDLEYNPAEIPTRWEDM